MITRNKEVSPPLNETKFIHVYTELSLRNILYRMQKFIDVIMSILCRRYWIYPNDIQIFTCVICLHSQTIPYVAEWKINQLQSILNEWLNSSWKYMEKYNIDSRDVKQRFLVKISILLNFISLWFAIHWNNRIVRWYGVFLDSNLCIWCFRLRISKSTKWKCFECHFLRMFKS